MSPGPGLYLFLALVLTCIVAGILAVYVRRRREMPGAGEFFRLSLTVVFLACAEILSLFSRNAEQARFWFQVRFLFSAFAPVFFLRFALDYSRRKIWVSGRLGNALFLVPLVTQVLIWTNDRHHLFVRTDVAFHLQGPFWLADTGVREAGVGFLIHSIFGIMLVLAGIVLIWSAVLKIKPRAVGQAVFVSAGGLVGVASATVSAFNLFPQAAFNIFTPGTGLSFFLFAVAVFPLRLFKRAPVSEHAPDDVSTGRSLAEFIFVFAVLASGIVAVGYVSFRDFERNLRVQAENQLSAIAELKANELRDWREERLADAEMLQQDTSFSGLVGRFFERPDDRDNREELQARLFRYQAYRQYRRAFLLDMTGSERLSVPAWPDDRKLPAAPEYVSWTVSEDRPILVDFHRDAPGEPIHISLYVPIYSQPNRGQPARPLGAVVFWIDPELHLFPYVMNWPGSSASAETLLVRREGEDVLFLNDLKFHPRSALELRLPLDRVEAPAVQAVLGREGVFEGRDYRDVPVLAALRAIPRSPWYLVARMDLAEIYVPIRDRLRQTLLLLAALITASGSAFGMLWRRQRLSWFRGRAEIGQKLRESLERFELANRATFDVMWDWDLKSDVLWWSDHFRGMFGYDQEEVGTSIESWTDRIHPDDRDRVISGIHAVIDGGGQIWTDHYRFRRRDGRYLDVFDRGFVARDGAGKPYRMIGAIQDLTDRISAEKAAIQSRDMMRYIIEHNRSAVAVHDRDLRYLFVSQRYLDEYGVTEKDVIGRHHYEVFPDLPQKWRDVHQQALNGIISSAEDDPYPRADGTVDWTRWECRPWYEADGSIGGIIVYTEVVTERKKSEDAIRASLREKEVLLKEIHHRVKNNMQVISSLLNLQAVQIGDERFREALKETQRRIRSMALLHEKLYKSRDLSRIDFVEYAQSLMSHLFHSFLTNPEKIKLHMEMEPAFFDIATANPLGLILNELFSNAIKHAFPGDRTGEISVGLCRLEGDDFLLTVRDNGVGLPSGFDVNGKGTFGIQIIDSLVGQLNGSLRVGKAPSGALFELRFQELRYAPRLDPAIAPGPKS